MQIKQLPEYSGTPTDNSVFALDDTTHNYKLSFSALASAIITAATATLNGVTQTVKAAIDALGAKTAAITRPSSGTTNISDTDVVCRQNITAGGSHITGGATARMIIEAASRKRATHKIPCALTNEDSRFLFCYSSVSILIKYLIQGVSNTQKRIQKSSV